MSGVPEFVRHYWRGKGGPFLNLSDLDGAELERLIEELMQQRRSGVHHRAFGRRYMELRRRTESKMRELFVQAGGRPERLAPHYFVLGESGWFRNLAEDMQEVVLRVIDLPAATTSFTYPDSFTAMGLAPEYGLPYEPRPYHEQVFRLADLNRVIQAHGIPDDVPGEYDGYESRPFDGYIEIQLWSDNPIADLLPSTKNGRGSATA